MNEKRTRPHIGFFILEFVEVILSLYIISATIFLAVRYNRGYVLAIVFAFFGLGCVAGLFMVDIRGIQLKDEEEFCLTLCFHRMFVDFFIVILTALGTLAVSGDDRSDEIVAMLVPVFGSVDIVVSMIHFFVCVREETKPINNGTDDSRNARPECTGTSATCGAIKSRNIDFNAGDVSNEETVPPLYASSLPSYVSSPLPYEEPAPPYPAKTHSRV